MLDTQLQVKTPLPRQPGLVGRTRLGRMAVDLTQEYASSQNNFLSLSRAFFKVLSPGGDDISNDFGADYWRKVAQSDPQAASTLGTVVKSTIGMGVTLTPPVSEKHPHRARAIVIRDWCAYNFRLMRRPLAATFFEMFSGGAAQGYMPAELVWQHGLDPRTAAPRLVLRAIKPKMIEDVRFCTDQFGNELGMVARGRDGLFPGIASFDPMNDWPKDLIPREKFWIFQWNTQGDDPRGLSIYRPAYVAIWAKAQAIRMWLAFIAQFAAPIIAGFTPLPEEGALQLGDPDDDLTDEEIDLASGLQQSEEQLMLPHLQNLQGGSVAAFPGGSKIQVVEAHTSGEAFKLFCDFCDRYIDRTVTLQTLATSDSQFQARAASQTHQDVMGIGTRFFKLVGGGSFAQDVVRTMVRYNFGERDALDLAPEVGFEEVEPQDFADNAVAVGTLFRDGVPFTPEQIVDIYRRLNLPPADVEQVRAMLEERQQREDKNAALKSDQQQQQQGGAGKAGRAASSSQRAGAAGGKAA